MKPGIMVLICLLALPAMVFGASAPMVENHIFLPEKPAEKKETVSGDTLKAQLVFTGTLISEKGRYAFIKERKTQNVLGARKIFKEGDDISGATISRIASNHLVLNNNGDDIVFKLYEGNKQRPAPVKVAPAPQVVPEPQPESSQPAAGQDQGQPAAQAQEGKQDAAAPADKPAGVVDEKLREKHAESGSTEPLTSSNPFAEALKKAIEKRQSQPTTPAPNPFLEAIKRAQEKQ